MCYQVGKSWHPAVLCCCMTADYIPVSHSLVVLWKSSHTHKRLHKLQYCTVPDRETQL